MFPLAKKTFQIFLGLSIGSTIPLTHSFFRERKVIKLPKETKRQISSKQQEGPKEEISSQNAMQEAVQRMGETEGEKRCFWLFANKNLFELFMCINMQTLKSPSLFHYAWREKNMSSKDKLNEITEITYNGTDTLKMTFENGKTQDIPKHLLLSFAWYRKGDTSFIPKTHCSIKQIDNSKNYTLSCKPGIKEFTEIINPEPPIQKTK